MLRDGQLFRNAFWDRDINLEVSSKYMMFKADDHLEWVEREKRSPRMKLWAFQYKEIGKVISKGRKSWVQCPWSKESIPTRSKWSAMSNAVRKSSQTRTDICPLAWTMNLVMGDREESSCREYWGWRPHWNQFKQSRKGGTGSI